MSAMAGEDRVGRRLAAIFCVSAERRPGFLSTFEGGGGQISIRVLSPTGGTGSHARFSVFLKGKTHFLADEATVDQCNRKTPSTARSSAGLISLECATVRANSGPSRFVSQNA